MPVYFESLDRPSAVAVGPTANVLNAVDAEADRSCPTPSLPRQLLRVHTDGLRVAPEDKTAEAILLPPLPRQPLRVHADGLHLAPEDKTAEVIPLPPLPRQLLRVHAEGLCDAPEDETAEDVPSPPSIVFS